MANQYPVISAGSLITAGLLQSMIPVTIRKAARTDRASTATPADDPELTTTLQANAVYFVEMYIKYSARVTTNVAKFRTAWTVPAGATGNRTANGAGSSATDTSADNMATRTGVHGFTTTVDYGGRANTDNQLLAVETALVTTSSGGICALQWSQATSNANATTVYADSFMQVTRLA